MSQKYKAKKAHRKRLYSWKAKKRIPRHRRSKSSNNPDRFYRSRLERDIADDLTGKDINFGYEPCRIKYVSARSYVPDFILPNGILVEAKGWFQSSDRSKHLRIKEQHPDLDIRFVFLNAKQKLSRQSKTSYGDWCDRYGFKWNEKVIPKEWIYESAKKGTQQQFVFAT